MALTDDRSPRLNLPLPASTNKLKDDVLRLRDAMNTLDSTAVKQVKSFAALRTIIPNSAGDRIFIQSHTDNAADPSIPPCGEGWFVGYTTAQADDGGYVASNGGDWHWRREKNIVDLTVLDFGAIPGGVVDCAPAAKKMYDFVNGAFAKSLTNSLSPMIGIRFTAGTFYMTPLDMTKYGTKLWSGSPELPYYPSGYGAASHFILRGVDVRFGRSIATRIISDKSDAAVFAINHRYFTISGIEWDGQQTIQQDAYNKETNPNGLNLPIGATGLADLPNFLSNHQPFFTNECAGGTFANISYFRAANTGEAAIYYKDSLDSKITQIYGSRTGGNVVKVGWTNRMPGNWNHSTAIEITEFNFQYPYAPAIWIPRHGQGLIRNGWIEHGYIPMDL